MSSPFASLLTRSPRESLRALVVCVVVGAAAFLLALVVPLRPMGGDSVPGRLGAAVFACHATLDLREVDWIDATVSAGKPPYYALPAKDGAVVSAYGPAPALLGAPFLEGMVPGDRVTDNELARRVRWGAALGIGVAAMLLAAALCARTTPLRAATLALVVAASSAGATFLGEVLSQQTVIVLPLAAALATVAWSSWRRGLLLLFTPAILLTAFYVRPAAAFVLGAVGLLWILGWREQRRGAAWLAASIALGVLVALPQLAWCLGTWGTPLPTGQLTVLAAHATGEAAGFAPQHVLRGVAGLLASPSRGALWFVPILVAAVVVAARRGDVSGRVVAGGIVLHLLLIGSWPMWWGGLTYGPRLLDEAVWVCPWLFVSTTREGGRYERLALGLAATVTVAVGLLGGFRYDGAWEIRRNPDAHPGALWDFRDSPIAALVRGESVVARDAPAGPYVYCGGDRALELVRLRP